MKKFEFKLDALLRLREFREKKVKAELGEIVKQMQELKDEIVQLNLDIGDGYRLQEGMLRKKTEANLLHFIPYYLEGKKEHIKNRDARIYILDRKYNEKLEELKNAMGEVKVIEKLRDKKLYKYTRWANKKAGEEIENNFIMRRKGEAN